MRRAALITAACPYRSCLWVGSPCQQGFQLPPVPRGPSPWAPSLGALPKGSPSSGLREGELGAACPGAAQCRRDRSLGLVKGPCYALLSFPIKWRPLLSVRWPPCQGCCEAQQWNKICEWVYKLWSLVQTQGQLWRARVAKGGTSAPTPLPTCFLPPQESLEFEDEGSHVQVRSGTPLPSLPFPSALVSRVLSASLKPSPTLSLPCLPGCRAWQRRIPSGSIGSTAWGQSPTWPTARCRWHQQRASCSQPAQVACTLWSAV